MPLLRSLENSLSEKPGRSMAWAQHWHGMAYVNQTRSHCVNQKRKTQTKSLAARHGMGAAWARHRMSVN